MRTATIENGKSAAINLGHLAARTAGGKILAEDLVDMGKRKAQKMIRRGYEAGEDYLDDTTHYIKHHPWQSIGVVLGLGITIGFLGGFFSRRG